MDPFLIQLDHFRVETPFKASYGISQIGPWWSIFLPYHFNAALQKVHPHNPPLPCLQLTSFITVGHLTHDRGVGIERDAECWGHWRGKVVGETQKGLEL